MASIPSTGGGECRGKEGNWTSWWFSACLWSYPLPISVWVCCCWASQELLNWLVSSVLLHNGNLWMKWDHDRQPFCPTPEQPATLPLVPGYTRACQELDRAGRDLAVTGCPCPFLSFCHRREMSLWHVVCGGCQVALAEGTMAPHEVSLPPSPQSCFVQWVETSLISSLDTKQSLELQCGSPSRLERYFSNPDFRSHYSLDIPLFF